MSKASRSLTSFQRRPRLSPPTVRVGTDSFVWSGSVAGYSNEDAWFPAISSDGAVLQLGGEIRTGRVYVQLMDGVGAVVYERTFDCLSPSGFSVRATGARGVWMVTLVFEQLAGRLRVELGPVSG